MGVCKSRAKKHAGFAEADLVRHNSANFVAERFHRLANIDLLVLDNSLRETSVGQIRGHTPDDKWNILEHVRSCEFKHVIVAALTSQRRCDDRFCEQLREAGEDFANFYAFTDINGATPQFDKPWDVAVPAGLLKMKTYGIPHPILEIDLACSRTDYSKVDICAYTKIRLEWVLRNLSSEANPSRIVINIRDLCTAMRATPERVLSYVEWLASLDDSLRPFGLITEEPTGEVLPEEFGFFIGVVRDLWPLRPTGGGHLLVHVHKSFGLAEATVMEALTNGADGIWCAICEEGAAVGHAGSALTITNLIRYGNQKVTTKYNWTRLRQAAIEITRITTGKDPDPRTELYGARATDQVFDVEGMKPNFDFAEFSQVVQETRITDLATENQLRKRLCECYGSEHDWDDDVISDMKSLMIKDMEEQRKVDYTSAIGIGVLYTNAGGHLPVGAIPISDMDEHPLIVELHELWKENSVTNREGDDIMCFRDFYDMFMSRYFNCFRCEVTELALQKFDLDTDENLSWQEFRIWLFWALQEFPKDASTMETLVSTVFEKGILPYTKRPALEYQKSRNTLPMESIQRVRATIADFSLRTQKTFQTAPSLFLGSVSSKGFQSSDLNSVSVASATSLTYVTSVTSSERNRPSSTKFNTENGCLTPTPTKINSDSSKVRVHMSPEPSSDVLRLSEGIRAFQPPPRITPEMNKVRIHVHDSDVRFSAGTPASSQPPSSLAVKNSKVRIQLPPNHAFGVRL